MEDAISGGNAPIDLAALPSLLDRLATPLDQSAGTARFLHELVLITRRVMQADHVLVREYDEYLEPADIKASASSIGHSAAIQRRIDKLMSLAAQNGRTEIDPSDNLCLIATVSGQPGEKRTVLATALDLGQSSIEPFVVTQQWITSSIATWHARLAQRQARRAEQLRRWITEMQESIDRSDTDAEVATSIVDAVAINLNAHQVALCRNRGNKLTRIEVAAIGGSGTPISDALWKAAASETLIRGGGTCWPVPPPTETNDRPADADERAVATIAHRVLAQSVSAAHEAISVPLLDENGRPFAVLAAVFSDGGSRFSDRWPVDEFASISEMIARRVVAWKRSHQPLAQRAARSLSRWLRSRLGFIAMVVVVAMISMLPVPYRVTGNASVVPHTRSFLVAPHTGLLKATHVRIGDVVERGSPIAELDDRELRIEMAALLAQRDRAAKQRDIQRALGDVAEEQLAEFELARVNEQIKLTKHRLDNLAVASPIDGVVLAGELEDVSGAPVETGQLLAEIALLDRLWIEIDVPEEEFNELRIGQQLRVALDGADGSVIAANIDSISPGAQVRGGENVFVVRSLLDNDSGLLRPGIRGTAKITGDERPLVAVILRHVWRRLCRLWI